MCNFSFFISTKILQKLNKFSKLIFPFTGCFPSCRTDSDKILPHHVSATDEMRFPFCNRVLLLPKQKQTSKNLATLPRLSLHKFSVGTRHRA